MKLNSKIKLNRSRKITPTAQPVRVWSNEELRKVSRFFSGDIINVSGWEDKDKQGSYYKKYFSKVKSYTVSNFTPSHSDNKNTEILIDLEKPLSSDLKHKFDVVLSHTNLEHIFDVFTAFKNHCDMSKDIVIVIVPFIQQQHETEEFKDFWRFTPSCLRELFRINGLTTVYEATNGEAGAVNYLLFVGSKNPKKWNDILPTYTELYQIAPWVS